MSVDWRSAGKRVQKARATPQEKVGAMAFKPERRPYAAVGMAGCKATIALMIDQAVQLMSFQFET